MGRENADAMEIKKFRHFLLTQAIEEDSQHGPFLSELINPYLINELIKKQRELKNKAFTAKDLAKYIVFYR